jgi:hypothetical protein
MSIRLIGRLMMGAMALCFVVAIVCGVLIINALDHTSLSDVATAAGHTVKAFDKARTQ